MSELALAMNRLAIAVENSTANAGNLGALAATLKAHMEQDAYIFGQYAKAIEKIETGISDRHRENRTFNYGIITGIIIVIVTQVIQFVHFGH